MSINGNQYFTGISSSLDLNMVNVNSLSSSSVNCYSISNTNNPYVASRTIVAVLPDSYYTQKFQANTPIFLIDKTTRENVSLPLQSNAYLIHFICYINNLGPGAGGTWGGTANVTFGTSSLETPTVSLTIAGAADGLAPFDAPIPVGGSTGFATGTNNYTGSFIYNHNTSATRGVSITKVVTSATSGKNYLVLSFNSDVAIVPGNNNAIGSLTLYISYSLL